VVGLTATTVVLGYAVGAAGLGLWVVVRFPLRGPQTMGSAVAAVACSYLLLRVSAPLTGAAVRSAGAAVALPCIFLPFLTLVFWSAAHFVRTAAERVAPFRR
jgi:hypothetical protein